MFHIFLIIKTKNPNNKNKKLQKNHGCVNEILIIQMDTIYCLMCE
jgi:hypothetical protein